MAASQLLLFPDLKPRGDAEPSVVFRELPPHDFALLKDLPPFPAFGTPNPEIAKVIVGQEEGEGRIVFYGVLFQATHIEPVWIHPEYRKRSGFARRCWRSIMTKLQGLGVKIAFGVVEWDFIPRGNLAMAGQLGFKKVPGDLYYLLVP